MATTPPPYIDITGIYTADDKHQAISRVDYDGLAKPGQLVVDTADYSLWIGNANGALNPVSGGSGVSTRITNGDSEIDIPAPSDDITVTVNNTTIFDITQQGIIFSNDLYFADDNGVIIENNGGDLEIKNTGDDILISTQDGGDNIHIYAGDDIRIYGGDKDYDSSSEGGYVSIEGGDGSSGDTQNAGNGGYVEINGGQGGTSTSGIPGTGGLVDIHGGYSYATLTGGGKVRIYGGYSVDNIRGPVEIGIDNQWVFNENNRYVKSPLATLGQLDAASDAPGARAMINDSTVAASGNFGAIAAGGGSNLVPVFSDGTNWLIG